jgi:hypothetical protein
VFFLSKEYCIFVMMTTLTVNIGNKKTEKAIKAVLDAFGLDYSVEPGAAGPAGRPLTQSEQHLYKRLKNSFEQIKLHREGKVKLQDARAALLEIEAELGE